jgi:phosphatidylethanolamine/phosphatidyl-N-methylethanolamine N-methyltransferase
MESSTASNHSPNTRPPQGVFTFVRSFMANPTTIGSLFPSSRFLAKAIVAPFRKHQAPANVLELGAGTGAFTVHLGDALGPDDRLDVCEMQPELVRHLEDHVLTQPQFLTPVKEDRVALHACRVEELDIDAQFDFIVSGLPFTSFAPEQVQSILNFVQTRLKPGGVFSYFEYIALRRIRTLTSLGAERRRMTALNSLLNESIQSHQFAMSAVWCNVTPAWARHWKFS